MKTNLVFTFCFLITAGVSAEDTLVGFKTEPFVKKNSSTKFYGAGTPSERVFDYSVSSVHTEPFDADMTKLRAAFSVSCDNRPSIPYAENFSKNLGLLSAPFIKLQCDAAKVVGEKKELTPESCLGLAGCLKTKMDFKSSEAREVFARAREQAAKEAIALTSKNGISQMMEYEALKEYALLKYGKDFMPKACAGVDILRVPKSAEGQIGCSTKIIDDGYALAQSICRIPESGCSFDYIDYTKSKKREDTPNGSLLSSYISDVSKKKAAEGMQKDTGMLQKIAYILADSSLTPEKRSEDAMKLIYANYLEVDPIIKSYYDRSFASKIQQKKDPIMEGLLSYIKANEKKSSVDILADLEDLRKSEAKSLLESKCNQVNTMAGFCSSVTDILSGATVMVDKKEFDKMLSRKPELTEALILRDTLASNVARCNTFNLYESVNGLAKREILLSGDNDLFSDADGSSFNSNYLKKDITPGKKSQIVIDANGVMSKTTKDFNSIALTKLSENKDKDKGGDLVLTRSFARNAPMPESFKKISEDPGHQALIAKKESAPDAGSGLALGDSAPKSIVESFMAQQKNAAMAGNKQPGQEMILPDPNTFANNIRNDYKDESVKPDTSKSSYNQMMDKVSSLEERLAKAQKKIADGTEKVEDTKKTEAATSSDSESSLMAELKNARNALAEMNKKRIEANSQQTGSSAIAEKSVALYPGQTRHDEEVAEYQGYRDSRDSAPSVASSSKSSGPARSVASRDSGADFGEGHGDSGHISSSRSGNDEMASADRLDSIVLTKVDGVTNAKMSQTIKDLIYAESGKPFYIEENGMVKEIVPQVVDGEIQLNEDGTPIYKTIVKGKVGEFKVELKDKDDKKKDKKMAKQESAADVKKSDEKSAPAVRYRDLRDILKRTTEVTN